MASNPEKELRVFAFNKDVSPGFLYDLSTEKLSPGDTKHTINIEKCTPEYVIEVQSKEKLSYLLKNSEVFRNADWAQDFNTTKYLDFILLKGRKNCEYKGNVEPDAELHVVSSVCYSSFIHFLICFDHQIQEKDIADLTSYIESLKEMKINKDIIKNHGGDTELQVDRNQPPTTVAFIPDVINNGFSNGYLYEMGQRTVVSSIKYGLEEFCYYLLHSQVGKTPFTFQVKCPVVPYASVLKKGSTDNVPVKRPAGHSYCMDGVSDNVAPIVKPRQGTELPVAHNTRRNTNARATNLATFSQHKDITVKNLSQSKNVPDKTHACLPRKDKIFGKPVDERREQKVIPHHISDRKTVNKIGEQQVISDPVSDSKSWQHNNNEAHNTTEVPQDNACTQYSNKSMRLLSSKTLTKKSEYDELDTYASKKCKYELKSNNSTVKNYVLETQLQGNPNLHHVVHGVDTHFSENPQSLVEESQLKLKDKTVKSQFMSENAHHAGSNPSEFNSSNSESSTLLKPVKESEVCGMTRKFYGVIPETDGKTIIFLGASGSGKTTLVNFIGNYFSGNKKAAGKLIHVVRNSNDIQGHTKQITGYTFCANKEDNPLTIIDTPGLNDSSGAEVQDHVQSLKTFLANADSQNLKIHAIGFVAQAHIVRLTSSERLVMDYIFSLFGKEIGEHVISFVTFSDNQETPPVVEAINNYGVSCSAFLKFNNSALSCNNEEEIDELDRIYWRIGCKSWKKGIKLLQNLPALSFKSLTDEIHVTQIMEVAERELSTEMKDFINLYRRNEPINKEMLNNAERVWVLAETIKELMCVNASQCAPVNSILQNHAIKVCASQNSSLSAKECVKLLSMSPSRPLLKTGLGIISSVAPIYNSVKQMCGQSQKLLPKKVTSDVIFCHICKKDHDLSRTKTDTWLKETVGISFKTNVNIGYKCAQCKCDGDVHGKKENEPEKYEAPEPYGFTPGKLLHHTKNCIEKVLKDLCLPEHDIQQNEYIKWLKCIAKKEAHQFCDDLLRS